MHRILDFIQSALSPLKLPTLKLLSRLFLIFETIEESFWLLIAWVLLFASLWLFNVPSALDGYAPLLLLLIFFVGLIVLSGLGLRQFQWPSADKIEKRLEQSSALKHRPFTIDKDDLATESDYKAVRLWGSHKNYARALLNSLKLPKLKSDLPRRDPYALRMIALFLFISGLFVAGDQWNERLKNGFTPLKMQNLPGFSADGAIITITPPAYTAWPAFTLKGHIKDRMIHIPAGSRVKAQVQGGLGHPSLWLGETQYKMDRLDGRTYGYEAIITDDRTIKLTQGFFPRVKADYALIADHAPFITIDGEAEITTYQSFQIPMSLQDDYGVRDVSIRVDLDPVITEAPLGDPHFETRAVMTPPAEKTALSPAYDLTSHVWAGLPVIVTVIAEDIIGHKAKASLSMTLPERQFEHPIAKKLIEHRKTLAWDYNAPTEKMIDSLFRMQIRPDDYGHDIVVLLALRTAAARLYFSPGEETAKALIDLFWNVAVHLEDGDINLALRRLQEAQRDLEEALSDPNTSEEEIAQKVETLRQAMADYFREMARELQKRVAEGKDMPLLPPEMLSQMMNPDQFAQFFDQLQSEALDNPDKARELLSQLNKFLDQMNPSLSMTMPPEMQMMMDGTNELQELVRRQEELLDQTRQQADALEEKDSATPNTQGNKVEQEALRFVLGQLMLDADRVLGEIPPNMGKAEHAMRQSSEALGQNDPQGSVPSQAEALKHLREAMQDLSDQMMAMMQQMTGFTLGQSQTDPFGRPLPNEGDGNSLFNSGSGVKIPQSERKQVEEILRLLRKRSGEFNRPQEEREYYRRLLKQF